MNQPMFAGIVIGLLLAIPAPAEDASAKDTKALQGTWTVAAAEKDGQAFDLAKGGTMTIKDTTFTIKTKGGTEMEGDLRLDPDQQPKALELVHQKGLLRDKLWKAIYTVDEEELRLCYGEIDGDGASNRPKEFKTANGDGFLLIVLKRDKK